MREGTPPRWEKRKEKERELVARLTPEICYIDLAFPLRRGAEIVTSFLRKREFRRGTYLASKPNRDEKEGGELPVIFYRCQRYYLEFFKINFIETIRLPSLYLFLQKKGSRLIFHCSFPNFTRYKTMYGSGSFIANTLEGLSRSSQEVSRQEQRHYATLITRDPTRRVCNAASLASHPCDALQLAYLVYRRK